MKLLKEIEGVFKAPVKKYYLGKIKHGTPYFMPWGFLSTIISIKSSKQKFNRAKYFKVLDKFVYYGTPIFFKKVELGWKDKWDSPRFEWSPAFHIFFFKYQFTIWWIAPKDGGEVDKYWEMILWWAYYCNKDIKKAESTWGWGEYITEKTTWDKDYLV